MSAIQFIPLPSLGPEAYAIIVNNFQELENLLNGRLDSANLAEKGVQGKNIGDSTVERRSLLDGIAWIASGQYTGDGTANREINVGFMPRYVLVLNHTDSITFEGLGSGAAAYAAWWRTSTGAVGSGATDWQGVSTNGFRTGTNAASLSNKSGVTYSWVAVR